MIMAAIVAAPPRSPGTWAGLFALVSVLLALDLGILRRGARAGGLRAGLAGCAGWMAAAIGFGAFLRLRGGSEQSQQYFAGYLVELSLSVDNLFVFVLVFDRFRIDPARQHRVLFWGIVGAIVLRTGFILAGLGAITRFHWLLYVFGALILATGVKLARSRAQDRGFDPAQNAGVRFLTRLLPIAPESAGTRFFARIDGRRAITPLFAALLVLEAADLVFALDSIPAVLAITRDLFVAVASNLFAILGLRSLYLVVSDSLLHFRFLRAGLSILLVFIGAKMLAEPWVRVPTAVSLGVIGGVLAAAIGASWLGRQAEEPRRIK